MYPTAIYGRTSRDDPRKLTIELQQTTLHEWGVRDPQVERVVGEFWDEGVSGKIPLKDRPAGRKLLEAVVSGQARSVAVVYVDRFGRTLLDGLQAAAELEKLGVKLVAVNDGWDARREDSPLFFQIRLAFAEEEHRRIRARMEAGKRRAAERDNAPPGGSLVFGYRMDARGCYQIDPIEGPIVVRVFEMARGGCSHREIIRYLESTGVRPGRRWQKRNGEAPHIASHHGEARWLDGRISTILGNRIYLGERRWGGKVFPVPPLVDAETFAAVQAQCERNAKQHAGRKGLLSGLIECGKCGNPWYLHSIKCKNAYGKRYEYTVYKCDSTRRGHSCRIGGQLHVEPLERDVWEQVRSFVRNPEEVIRRAIAAGSQLSESGADLDVAEADCLRRLGEIEAEVATIWEQQAANGWPLSFVAPKLNKLNARREGIAEERLLLAHKRLRVSTDQAELNAITRSLVGFHGRLAFPTEADKREIIRAVVSKIVVHPNGREPVLRLHFRLGEEFTRDSATTSIRQIMGKLGIILDGRAAAV